MDNRIILRLLRFLLGCAVLGVSGSLLKAEAAPSATATYELVQERAEWDDEFLELQSHRVHLTSPVTPELRLSVTGGFVRAEAEGNRSVSQLSDTQLTASWRPVHNLMLRLATNIPTGSTELRADEFDLAVRLQDDLLNMAVPSLGSGTVVNGGVSYTFSPAPRWSVGVGSAFGLHSDLRPLDGGAKLERGMRLSTTGAVDYSSAAWGWRSQLSWGHRADGAIEGTTISVDPTWGIETAVVGRKPATHGFLRFGYSVPSRYGVSAEEELLSTATRGPRVRVGLGGGWRLHRRVDSEGSVEFVRHSGWDDGNLSDLGAASRTELRLGAAFRVAADSRINLRLGLFDAQIDGNPNIDEADRVNISGYRVRLALEQRFR